MARPKKQGKRAKGIQAKNGALYIVTNNKVIKDGIAKHERTWRSTGLKDTPENVKIASELRSRLLENKSVTLIDRNITLSDYTDIVLEKKQREVSDTTYSGYLYRAKKIKEFFGDTKLKSLDTNMVEAFLDALFEKYNVQPRTAKDIKVLLGNIIDLAIKDGIILTNPAKEVIINKNLSAKYAKEKSLDDEFFSFEEAQLFLEKARYHELYELFYITLFFGLRREEVLGLRWSAINTRDKTMTINHTVTKGTKINRLNSTKTVSSARVYPLTDEQLNLFQNLKDKEIKNRKLFGNGYYDSDYIFKHEDGTLYYPDYPTKAFGKLIKRNPELPQGITFHGLRISCVSILVNQGNDIKSIQKWVGHADIDTTLRIYAKVKDKAAKRDISQTMDNLISLKTDKNQ